MNFLQRILRRKKGELNRTKVSSSMIESFGYDSSRNLLEVEFKKGQVYQYSNVPQYVYAEMKHAAEGGESIGEWFSANIRNNASFPFSRVA